MMVTTAGLGTAQGQITVYRDPTTGEVITEQWDEPTKSWIRITPLTGGPSQNLQRPYGYVDPTPVPGPADYNTPLPCDSYPGGCRWDEQGNLIKPSLIPGISDTLLLVAVGLFLVVRMAK
jgi:hypothetical protein